MPREEIIYHDFNNILGVLDTSIDDFESSDDVFEAIGGVLQEVANNQTEDDIKKLCDQLMHTLRPDHKLSNGNSSVDKLKVLDNSVTLGMFEKCCI